MVVKTNHNPPDLQTGNLIAPPSTILDLHNNHATSVTVSDMLAQIVQHL